MSRFPENFNVHNSEIQQEIMYTIYVRNVWICKKNWISRTAKIQWEIVYIVYVWNGWICQKIEYPELRKFDGKVCMLYMYGMSGFAKKLNIQNCEISKANFVHYICTKGLDLQKNWISRTTKIQWEIVYIIYVRKVWICRKIEYSELRKFIGKLCTLYMYVTFGFAKNWISRTAKIQREIEYIIYIQNG